MQTEESKTEPQTTNDKFKYGHKKIDLPTLPNRNDDLRGKEIVSLTTNLLKLKISEEENKLCLYSVAIIPELDKNNFGLYSYIQRQCDVELGNFFKKKCFSGYNLFASCQDPPNNLVLHAKVKETDFTVKFTKVGDLDMSSITDFDGINQKKKSFVERVIKDILLKNNNTIKFGDDSTIVKINESNVINPNPNHERNKESIIKGFYTSAQITENGLFLLVSNVNKYIMDTTVYDIIHRIMNDSNKSEEGKRKEIEEFFKVHKTVLSIYGSFRTYRVRRIDFDASPTRTTFNIKDLNHPVKTVSIMDYYKNQYNIQIKDPHQPLVIAERKAGKKKALPSPKPGENNNNETENESTIYLVPELIYPTGMETSNDSTDRRRNIIQKTKIDPNKKIEEIGKIREMMQSTTGKSYRGKDNNTYISKSANQVSKEWGVNLGENLSVQGRLLPQPELKYKTSKVKPNNGNFRSGNVETGASITMNNFAFVYDTKDKSNIQNSLKGLLQKGKMKGMGIELDKDLRGVHSVALKNSASWDDIKHSLGIIERNKSQVKMVIVFLSPMLEKQYSNLKEFFTNTCQIPTQFVVSKKLQDPKRAGSIMFNIVEQINIKMGGVNFYIDFFGNKVLKEKKIYMILGLEVKCVGGEMNYIMTSTTNPKLNRVLTTFKTCKNNNEEKERTIAELMNSAIKGIMDQKAPHYPDYIILYRQGGNSSQNSKLAENEVPYFTNFFKAKKESDPKFKEINPKFLYVCCNLKGDLKFFQTGKNKYENPKSGLCVDSQVVQKDKYEFYIQPQFVNQGTATPCHYQVLYEDRDKDNEENNVKLEELQLLSFYLSYYYWTWSGAVRVPGLLKFATTAMEYSSKHLNNKVCLPNQQFITPSYI